jgi:hypothetical protein
MRNQSLLEFIFSHNLEILNCGNESTTVSVTRCWITGRYFTDG